MLMYSLHFGLYTLHTDGNVILHQIISEESAVKRRLCPLFLLNVSQADGRLMWPVIRGPGERIPIHLSFAAHELVNRPENASKDIHGET